MQADLLNTLQTKETNKMADFNIALIKGDGIGPEIENVAVTELDAVAKK